MDTDLEQIDKPLSAIIKEQTETPTGETQMFFDNIHLSPLKVTNIRKYFPKMTRRFRLDSCEFLHAWIKTK